MNTMRHLILFDVWAVIGGHLAHEPVHCNPERDYSPRSGRLATSVCLVTIGTILPKAKIVKNWQNIQPTKDTTKRPFQATCSS